MSHPDTFLFVCLHGAAKSFIAARYLERLAADRGISVVCRSAGVEPDSTVPPHVIEGLRSDGIEVAAAPPVGVTAAMVASAQHVVAFGCNLSALGAADATQWDDVPAVSDGYGAARDVIVARLHSLVDELETRTTRDRQQRP